MFFYAMIYLCMRKSCESVYVFASFIWSQYHLLLLFNNLFNVHHINIIKQFVVKKISLKYEIINKLEGQTNENIIITLYFSYVYSREMFFKIDDPPCLNTLHKLIILCLQYTLYLYDSMVTHLLSHLLLFFICSVWYIHLIASWTTVLFHSFLQSVLHH